MSSKEWDKITYPIPNFNECTIEVWEWINNFSLHLRMIYLSMIGLKLQKGPQKATQKLW